MDAGGKAPASTAGFANGIGTLMDPPEAVPTVGPVDLWDAETISNILSKHGDYKHQELLGGFNLKKNRQLG